MLIIGNSNFRGKIDYSYDTVLGNFIGEYFICYIFERNFWFRGFDVNFFS